MEVNHEYFMQEALKLAELAYNQKEVPVGAVIVRDGEIVGCGYNTRKQNQNAVLHAETVAIYNACKKLGSWRLWNCDMYVTLEPCPMCTGAIINSRICNVYYGAKNIRAGACGSVINLGASMSELNMPDEAATTVEDHDESAEAVEYNYDG